MNRKFYVLGSLVLMAVVALGTAQATASGGAPAAGSQDNNLRMYYSEDIGGGGERVYHIRACDKELAWGPVRCMRGDETKYNGQCVENNVLKEGSVVYCCKSSSGGAASSTHSWPVCNPNYVKAKQTRAQGGCSDDPENLVPVPGQEWALVTKGNPPNNDDASAWTLHSTIIGAPLQSDSSLITEAPSEIATLVMQLKRDNKLVNEAVAVPYYRTKNCGEVDFLENGTIDENSSSLNLLGSQAGAAQGAGRDLMTAGCDNNNSGHKIQFSGQDANLMYGTSTSFDPNLSLSCTIQYRITGASGVDIFGQYIAALYRWAAGIVGIICVLVIVVSGAQISMSGDTGNIDEAKKRIMQSVLGLVLLFLSGLILYAINPGFFT